MADNLGSLVTEPFFPFLPGKSQSIRACADYIHEWHKGPLYCLLK